MAMNLRLSPAGEARLERLAANAASKTAVIEAALEELDDRTAHRAVVQASFAQTAQRDAELLERLSR